MPLPTTRAGFAALAWLAVANSIGGVVLLFVLLRRGTGAAVSGCLPGPRRDRRARGARPGQPVHAEILAGLAVTLAGVVLVNRDARPVPAPSGRLPVAVAPRG